MAVANFFGSSFLVSSLWGSVLAVASFFGSSFFSAVSFLGSVFFVANFFGSSFFSVVSFFGSSFFVASFFGSAFFVVSLFGLSFFSSGVQENTIKLIGGIWISMEFSLSSHSIFLDAFTRLLVRPSPPNSFASLLKISLYFPANGTPRRNFS